MFARWPGIYNNYQDVIVQIQRYRGAEYRSFDSYINAIHYHDQQIESTMHTYPSHAEILMQFDGGSQGKPGDAGSGPLCWTSKVDVGKDMTNDYAECEGLLLGLRYMQYHNLLRHTIEVQGYTL